jgi:hypothetical protein
MENEPNQQSIFARTKTPLPNATAVLVLGICSIVCACFGIGFILGIIGLVLSSRARKIYFEAPDIYEDYGQVQAGFILSIIGTVFGALGIAYLTLLFVFQIAYGAHI